MSDNENDRKDEESSFINFIMKFAEASNTCHTIKQLQSIDKMPMGSPEKKMLKKVILDKA